MSHKPTYEDFRKRNKELEKAGSERNLTEEALEKRLISQLTPLEAPESISIEDLFNLEDLQRLQDDFAQATGVASIITHTDGRPITESSNFCRLCSEIIRNTEVGRANCFHSDSLIGRACVDGPTILPCLSGGLWDAGAGITVGGRHIGNWLIGQVRDETQSEASLRAYARKIGADEDAVAEAFQEVPAMNRKQFERIAQVLYTLASQLSTSAYLNLQQKRFITERKQAEEALESERTLLRNLIDNVPDRIYAKDSEGRFIICNEALARRMGMDSPTEIVGKSDFDFLPREMAQRFRTDEQTIILSGIPMINREEPLTTEGGTITRWNLATKVPLLDKQGNRIGIVGVGREITDRKRAEAERAELEAQNRQLQKAESLGSMAGAIAHHFNNQLCAVMGNLEIAMDDLPLGVNLNENLTEAMQAARKAADVSRMMLTYLGQTSGKHEPIDLSEACRQSLILLQAAVPKGTILNVDFPSCGPVILADVGQIRQVLTNLITNAWEATGENKGTIGLTVKMVPHTDIPISKRFPIDWQPQKIAYTCLEVSDTGCGISNKDIEKLFDPFFTTKFTGRGLGLPVVMGIVKAHGGGVAVESEPGQGSVFRIFLPVSTEELPCRHDLPTISGALQTGKAEKVSKIEGGGTVLMIEDEEQVRNMAKKMLIRLGYTVLEAKDGVEAVEVFKQHQDEIRCVLSDMTMPRMDGWDTLAALRKISPDIPVILSSGYDEAQVMAGEHPEVPNAFLGKPYRLQELKDTIRNTLADKK